MKPAHTRKVGFLTVVVIFLAGSLGFVTSAAPPLPEQLTNEQFWELSTSLSEPDGMFRSDNLVSNEQNFQFVIPDLLRVAQPGRVYMGVGPEQNFTYIAALKPAMAFIVDIRHGNLDVHLMYKALFEMSANRVEFVSKLFSLKPPPGVSEQSTARELITAFAGITEFNDDLYKANLQAVIDHLKVKRGFPLSEGDLEGIRWAMSNYYNHGLFISYNSSQTANAPLIVGAIGQGGRGGGGGGGVRYMDLMIATDGVGVERSYLASEENFMVLKNLHMKNLLVPVVGDFGGPRALRAVGKYIKSAGGMVSAFYLSNVEQYLGQDGKTTSFLSNIATLPIDDTSRFISSGSGGRGGGGGMGSSMLRNMFQESRPYVEQ